MLNIAFIIGSYLLGCIPQVYLLGRLKGVDLRGEHDLHIALWRKVSRPLAVIGIIGDMAKGAIPILVGKFLLGLELWVIATAGLCAVLGQMWPIFFMASGGRGNSTGVAMAASLAPYPFLFALIPILIGVGSRVIKQKFNAEFPSLSLPLGMGIAFALLPLASLLLEQSYEITLALLSLFLAIMIRRLTVGIRADLKIAKDKRKLFLNRLLYDRSFI